MLVCQPSSSTPDIATASPRSPAIRIPPEGDPKATGTSPGILVAVEMCCKVKETIMSEPSTPVGGKSVGSAPEPPTLKPQRIRAEDDSVSAMVLRLPVPEDATGFRKLVIGKRAFDVAITPRDRDRGFVEINFYNHMSCISVSSAFGPDHEWCHLTLVACFDDGVCVEV